MSIAYIHHPDCLLHDMGEGHPECPARPSVIEDQLKVAGLYDFLRHHDAPLATHQQLARVHDEKYIDTVLSFSQKDGHSYLDPDTVIMRETPHAALRSAGALVLATELVLTHKVRGAFCNIRPPGHHALRDQAMGFCFFNNVAIGVRHALEEYGLSRVAIVDFDVHHGNGTEEAFRNDPRVLFCSTFQHPFYPYCGIDNVKDHIINVPLPAGTGGDGFQKAVLTHWLPALNKFAPQLIFVSAGFDAHNDDYMADLRLHDKDYAWVTHEILSIADRHADGHIVSTLEGGYDLPSLARSATAHVKVLMRMG